MSLDHAELIIKQQREGIASAYVMLDIDNSGTLGNIQYHANVTKLDYDNTNYIDSHILYYSNQSYDWSSNDGWLQDGSISISSQSIWDSWMNWHAISKFEYGDSKYAITVIENDFYTNIPKASIDLNNFYAAGYGGYGAHNVYQWYVY